MLRGVVRLDRVRRTHARLQAPIRRQLDQQHRARADVRIQRLRPRRRAVRRPRPDPARVQARLARGHRKSSVRARVHSSRRRRSPAPRRGRRRPATPVRSHRSRAPRQEAAPVPAHGRHATRSLRRPTGPLRLFGAGLGDQAGWMLPFAFFGLIALALWSLARASAGRAPEAQRAGRRPGHREPAQPSTGGRRDRRAGGPDRARRLVPRRGGRAEPVQGDRAPLLRLGARARHWRRWRAPAQSRSWRPRAAPARSLSALVLPARASRATVAAQLVLMHRENYMTWFAPLLVAGAAVGRARDARRLRRLAAPAMALMFGLLLVVPAAYAATTWQFAGGGHLPGRRPARRRAAARGGSPRRPARSTKALLDYVAHAPSGLALDRADASPPTRPRR